jgi:hypothetical protein
MNVTLRGNGFWCVVLLGLMCVWGGTAMASEAEVGLLAQLVWATEGTKPDDKKLKEVDSVTRDKLRGVFRWREYFEIARKEFKVSSARLARVRLSPKCEIEVERVGNEIFEVKLFGEGKMVVKQRQSLKPVELLVLAGDDKDDAAWFVVIRRQKSK